MRSLRIYIIYLYFFSLSIENWSPWGEATSLTRPAILIAVLYVLSSIYDFSKHFKINSLKQLLYPSFWVWTWISLVSFAYALFYSIDYSFNYTLLSCILSFWLISNDLRRYQNLNLNLLYIIVFNGLLLSFLSFFDVGVDIGHMGRESLLGNNSNIIGLSCVISILIILFFVVENPSKLKKYRFFLLFFLPFLLQTIAKTGSKGAIVTLATGFLAYLYFLKKPLNYKLPIVIVGLIGLLYGGLYMLQNEVLAERVQGLIETGDTTGRAVRWEFAFDTFINNMIVGVGENGLQHLARVIFGNYDPHNVYLYVLATGGLLAGIPLAIFLYRLYKNANMKRKLYGTSLPLVLLIVMLLFWFKAGGGLNSKLVWSYFALISYQPYLFIKNKKYVNCNT